MIDDVLRDVWHLVTKLRNERFIRDENDCRVKSLRFSGYSESACQLSIFFILDKK